jgi:uncharacterized protein YdaU (DUF1376 family)
MPFYIGDYLADTMGLSTEQHGAYVLLLFAYWRNRGPLPDDNHEFCRITGLMRDAWQSHRNRIAKFFQIESGHWHHKRVDLELAKALRNKESRTSAATKAAFARWNHAGAVGKTPMRDASLTHTPSPSDSTPLPLDAAEGVGGKELLSLEQLKAAVMTRGIPDEFVELVYGKWCQRGGKDGAQVPVEIVRYVTDRWKNEQVDWRSGTHRGSRQKGIRNGTHNNSRSGNPNASNSNSGKIGSYSAAAREKLGKPV